MELKAKNIKQFYDVESLIDFLKIREDFDEHPSVTTEFYDEDEDYERCYDDLDYSLVIKVIKQIMKLKHRNNFALVLSADEDKFLYMEADMISPKWRTTMSELITEDDERMIAKSLKKELKSLSSESAKNRVKRLLDKFK